MLSELHYAMNKHDRLSYTFIFEFKKLGHLVANSFSGICISIDIPVVNILEILTR